MFVTVSHLHLIVILQEKQEAYPHKRVLEMLANIRLVWKGQALTNTLAYLSPKLIAMVKLYCSDSALGPVL